MTPNSALIRKVENQRTVVRECGVPTLQRVLLWWQWLALGFLALGAVLDSMSNAMSLVTLAATYVGSILTLSIWLCLEWWLKKRGLDWVASNGQRIRLRGLGMKSRLPLVGCLVLLWLPRLFDRPDSTFPPPIPFNTGWIFLGYYDTETIEYVEGPFAQIVGHSAGRMSGGNGSVPRLGDVLLVDKPRRVIIAGFKASGLKYQLISPPLIHDHTSEADETGVQISKGGLVLVRDIEISGYPQRPVSIWCRIVACDRDTAQCRKALGSLTGRLFTVE